ncbi:DUF748 domain-containing protein [Geothrix limicola]|nr:DUF748 domain-containing protein [Geothrix limicola]
MNSKLKGYTVRIGRVHPHLWRAAFDLNDLVVKQDSHPETSVADFGALKFSLMLRELLRFKVVGDLTLVRPALHLNLTQIREEAQSHMGLKERGWQSAVESIFPFKLNQVKVQDGSLLYLSDRTASKPIQLTRVFMTARNVRNLAAAKRTYPSPITMEGMLFDTGRVWFKGEADFLREPYVAAHGDIRLQQVPLDRLSPLAQEYQLKTTGGFLSLQGSMEYTPEGQTAHLSDVELEGLRLDYVTSGATKAVEKQHAQQAVKLAEKVRNAPKLRLDIDVLRLKNSQFGFENRRTTPSYRVFMSHLNLDLEHLSNHQGAQHSDFHARGDLMGSGTTTLKGRIRSTARPADFAVSLEVEDAKLVDLNGMLMAHAGVDVADGLFSLYTEIAVKNGQVEGYVKPLIKNLRISDRQKDVAKPFRQRMKLHGMQFLANLFKNHSTHAVATVAHISGSTGGPKTSEWEVIRKLIGNGIFQAILPGFLSPSKTVAAPAPETHPRLALKPD